MIDLTTLEGADTVDKVKHICYKAMHLHDDFPGLPTTAAVCVYPNFVKTAIKELKDSGVKVASVATAFPSGQADTQTKLADVKEAVDNGADEVDMVISRGKFHSGDYDFVFNEIATIKAAIGKARLKVILETGELGNILGIDKIHFLKEKTSAIIRHVDEDIESLKLAHDELQKIYESSLSKEKICGNQIFRCRY